MRIRNILLAIIFILIIAGVGGFFYINTLKDPVNAQDTTKKEVTIESGSSGGQIAKILKENGLIKDEKYFLFYANQNKLANLKSGVYEISPSQNLEEILKMLKAWLISKDLSHLQATKVYFHQNLLFCKTKA